MASTTHVRKEYKVFSVEASNSATPGSYHLVEISPAESFKSYEDAQKWIEKEGDKTDYTILEVFTKKL